jgi:hypothetical protein
MSGTDGSHLVQTILAACSAGHEEAGLRAATAAIRRALLAFGSETPDNLACAAQIEFGASASRADGGSRSRTGLRLVGSNILLADILNVAEDASIPEPVHATFPDLSAESWAAVMRLVMLLVLSLECDS